MALAKAEVQSALGLLHLAVLMGNDAVRRALLLVHSPTDLCAGEDAVPLSVLVDTTRLLGTRRQCSLPLSVFEAFLLRASNRPEPRSAKWQPSADRATAGEAQEKVRLWLPMQGGFSRATMQDGGSVVKCVLCPNIFSCS